MPRSCLSVCPVGLVGDRGWRLRDRGFHSHVSWDTGGEKTLIRSGQKQAAEEFPPPLN